VLLRGVVYLGFMLALLGVALAAYALVSWISGNHLPSWTALPMFGLFLAAFIIITGGVTGLYVGKIFDQVKGRPLFVVDEIVGAEEGEEREPTPATADAPGSRSDPRAGWS
jgi:dolichol-phosphate mannosyltransferase